MTLPDPQAKDTCLDADLFLDHEKMRVVDWPECEAMKLLELWQLLCLREGPFLLVSGPLQLQSTVC